jgi:hypothetical protein
MAAISLIVVFANPHNKWGYLLLADALLMAGLTYGVGEKKAFCTITMTILCLVSAITAIIYRGFNASYAMVAGGIISCLVIGAWSTLRESKNNQSSRSNEGA